MSQTPEPTRLQLALREETWPNPGRTVLAWASASTRQPSPAVLSNPAIAECVCPTDCIRDHETD